MDASQLNLLLARYRRDRDNASFDALYCAMAPLVRSIARRHLRDPNDLDDLMQQVTLKVNRHLDVIHGNFVSWVACTTRTTCIDVIRRRNRVHAAQQRVHDYHSAEHVGVLTWEAARSRLDQAMADVDRRTRQLIVGRFLAGRPRRELADQQHMSVATHRTLPGLHIGDRMMLGGTVSLIRPLRGATTLVQCNTPSRSDATRAAPSVNLPAIFRTH